ncbi:la protein homolog [Diabrotica virgifera virgifera]|uniref:La protein homolog n=2 Tax=Diabrotica virgifera virgifera TaxID=50390 RepID=A0ABM5IL06_DIAVI|nr:la protein homolog [Diabrotica virgifera virgifera]XP_050517362.1 la protein homolog [Diabrotica virgifera virgifera]
MADDLEQKIIKQIEYYFGDINLPRDRFLQEKMNESFEGWIYLDDLLKCKLLSSLSTDQELIAKAIEKSENGLVVVSKDRKRLRRNPEKPSPKWNSTRRKEIIDRTAYAKNFPLKEEFSNIINFMEAYGPVESCTRRCTMFKVFKGSCFIVFKDVESCKKFVEQDSVKYGKRELIRKFRTVYFEDKRREKQEKKRQRAFYKECAKSGTPLKFPKGTVIHFSGIKRGEGRRNVFRIDFQEKVKDYGKIEVKFVDYNEYTSEGYLRFAQENEAVEFFKTVGNATFEIKGHIIKLRVLEGDEEEEYLRKTSDSILKATKNKQNADNKMKRTYHWYGWTSGGKVSKRD